MSDLEDIGERDGWRCWICDEPVDRDLPSRDPRAASVDARITRARARKKKGRMAPLPERLAHVGCNTGKGANEPGLEVTSRIDEGGGQFLVSLLSDTR